MAMLPNPFMCDVCKVLKQKTNDWLLMWLVTLKLKSGETQALMTAHWTDDLLVKLKKHDVKHICGLECASKVQNMWLTRQCLPTAGDWPKDVRSTPIPDEENLNG